MILAYRPGDHESLTDFLRTNHDFRV